MPFATAWVGLENVMLSDISQREKDKAHVGNIKQQSMNKLTDPNNRRC